MNFGTQIKKLRKDRKMTQEQMAKELGVSRQAVSNWENDRNLPDIEMLILISRVYQISLDELILGGTAMNNETNLLAGNNMTEKLIRDGKESRRAKLNLLSVSVGAVLLFMGVTCVLIKALTGADVDENGLLQENFFLLPTAFLFFFGGFATFLITGIHNAIEWGISKGSTDRQSLKQYGMICAGVLCLCAGTFLFLLESNSDVHTAAAGVAIFLIGLADIAATVMRTKRKNSPGET